MTRDRFEVATTLPVPLRIGLSAVGALIAIMTLKDLWRGLWPPSVLSPFFLIIMGGGALIGLTLIAAMLWGPDEHWVVAPGRVIITRSLRHFRAQTTHNAADFRSVEVVTEAWDSRADTFRLRMVLKSGITLCSPDFTTHGVAESARRLLLRASA